MTYNIMHAGGQWVNGGTSSRPASGAVDAMHFWIDMTRELGCPVPEPEGERLMLA